MTTEIEGYALDDAIETFTEEQLAYWYCDVAQPPEPKRKWIDGWLFRQSTEREWLDYRSAYRRYLRRAMSKLNDLWESFSERMAADDWDADTDVTQECLDAMEETKA